MTAAPKKGEYDEKDFRGTSAIGTTAIGTSAILVSDRDNGAKVGYRYG
jgi:hypothetical protein